MMIEKNVSPRRSILRQGYSLVEVLVVSTIMGIIVAIPIPQFAKAIEQSKLDIAAANLRSIWCAERYYFLEHNAYGQIQDLQALGLLDPSIASGTTFYAYKIDPADGQSFTATAQHPPSTRCMGPMTIDQTGELNSQVVYATYSGNVAMSPSMEPGS
jgi:prepilin-type N-terminal cleavage/methylation domain-containing protein